MFKQDKIIFDKNGKIQKVELSRPTTEELKQTGYAMMNDPSTSASGGIYFVTGYDDAYFVCKAVEFEMIELS